MPVYEYECTSCSSHFELIRSFHENGTVSCPECGGDAQRVFTPVPVIFKGSGFYVTDHRGANGASQPAEKKSASEDEKKEPTENKAETTGVKPESSSSKDSAAADSKD